jgi:hypothetical protein
MGSSVSSAIGTLIVQEANRERQTHNLLVIVGASPQVYSALTASLDRRLRTIQKNPEEK